MKSIIAANSKIEVSKFLDDINYNVQGKEFVLTDRMFNKLWKTSIISTFYNRTRHLIDDYETTIIDDDKDLLILKEIIERQPFGLFHSNLKRNLLSIINYAIENKSGIIFFL